MVAACAYCKSFIALREPFDDPSVTHGACDPCIERMLREWEALTAPVTVGPSEPTVRVIPSRIGQTAVGAAKGDD